MIANDILDVIFKKEAIVIFGDEVMSWCLVKQTHFEKNRVGVCEDEIGSEA